MDKSWITKPKWSSEFLTGVDNFLKFARQMNAAVEKILCPCKVCINRYFSTFKDVRNHLISNGFFPGYTIWNRHGEDHQIGSEYNRQESSNSIHNVHKSSSIEEQTHNDNIDELLEDVFHVHQDSVLVEDECGIEGDHTTNTETHIPQIVEDAQDVLYPGCKKFSKLSFILHLFRIKCANSWTAKSFDMLLELLSDAFPEGNSLPKSTYEVKKIMKAFDLGYQKIDVCPNDCMLFWREKVNVDVCDTCGSSRWTNDKKSCSTKGAKTQLKPAKVLRYFPLTPRLQRLFKSKKSAEDMLWHANRRNMDGLIRHPADAVAWKHFDEEYADFSSDPRNVRLGLASDGFTPFNVMSSSYSIWPVILVPYNLPPWVGMKQDSFMLSTIIPGPKSPGNDIDIFLQPLIQELCDLWKGVQCYDAATEENFVMRAALMWTINDFPAYGMLSGWSTKGRFACPCCSSSTDSLWLYNSKKFSYMGHRRWLPADHVYRQQSHLFNNTVESRFAPNMLTGNVVLSQLESVQFVHGKSTRKRQRSRRRTVDSRDNTDGHFLWKRRTIFFDLPYWKNNLLRHNLDVMHIEKNVCDNFLSTILDLEKSKDNLQARLDLVDIGVKVELHPQVQENGGYLIPPASYTLSRNDKQTLCTILKNIKFPKGYASNISRCVNVNDCKISGLKSHDCHVLIQDIFPIALQSCGSSSDIQRIVIDISRFLKSICCTVISPSELETLQANVISVLCEVEKFFLPSFFTVMVHLLIHLVEEIKLGGPVQYRWMYPFERFFSTLKCYVGNQAHPEGSIAEGYIAEEGISFCAKYLSSNVTIKGYRLGDERNDQYLFSSAGLPLGKVSTCVLDEQTLMQCHRYILRHRDDISSFKELFVESEKRKRRGHTRLTASDVDRLMHDKFHEWFRQHILTSNDLGISEEVRSLALGPSKNCKKYKGFSINGYNFHVKEYDDNKKTQSHGVVNSTEGTGFSYYGKVNDIIDISYTNSFRVVLFKCDWVNTTSTGMKENNFGYTLVNFSRLIHTGAKLEDDPYVFSSQVEPVFYIQDYKNLNWHYVVKAKPRDVIDASINRDVL